MDSWNEQESYTSLEHEDYLLQRYLGFEFDWSMSVDDRTDCCEHVQLIAGWFSADCWQKKGRPRVVGRAESLHVRLSAKIKYEKTLMKSYSYSWIIYLRRSVHTPFLRARRMSWRMWWKSRDGARCSRFRRSIIRSVPRIIIRLYWLFFWVQGPAWHEIAAVVAPRIVVIATS